MTRKKGQACPVCNRVFANGAGLQAHLKLAKDAQHTAHRKGPPLRSPLPQPAPKVEGPEDLPQQAPATAPVPTPVEAPAAPDPAQGTLMVTFEAPGEVTPLVAPQREAKVTPQGDAKAPAKVDPKVAPIKSLAIPLGPVINGGVAVMVNGFFLRGEDDGKVTPAEVAETHFGESAEAALREYFPDLEWDHPLVLLFVSGASLAAVVASKKAPKDKTAHLGLPAPTPPPPPAAPAPQIAAPPPSVEEQAATGYWSSIQAQAGGAPNE